MASHASISWWFAANLVCVFLAILISTSLSCDREGVAERPTVTAKRGRIERVVIATGTIEPATEVEVRPRIPGIVEKIHVKEGDVVQPGQPLVEIERDILVSQVREAEAKLRSAGVELRFAKIALNRVVNLHNSGTSSDQARDDALARHEQALAEHSRAEAAVDTLTTQLSYATVRSSISGRVLEVPTEEGNAVSPVTSVTGGTLLLSIAGDKTLHLEGLVDENDIALVHFDQPARVRTEAYRDRMFEGRVRDISPVGQRIQNVTYFEVKVELTDKDAALLRPRMSGDAEIITEVIPDAVIVPESVLRYHGIEILVDVDTPSETDPRRVSITSGRVVEIGIIDGALVQILSGIAEGERIFVQ